MKALITGASSGIGYDMANYLGSLGYDLILVSKNKKKKLENSKVKVRYLYFDLTKEENCYKLYDLLKQEKIDK